MELPDLRGYELESHIYSAPGRLVIVWFSKIEQEAECWRQIQVTLVGAKLSMVNLEIAQCFPPLSSYKISEKSTAQGSRVEFEIIFDKGEICFECEDITYSEFSRKIRTLQGSKT